MEMTWRRPSEERLIGALPIIPAFGMEFVRLNGLGINSKQGNRFFLNIGHKRGILSIIHQVSSVKLLI
jgi:hypothetical protein